MLRLRRLLPPYRGEILRRRVCRVFPKNDLDRQRTSKRLVTSRTPRARVAGRLAVSLGTFVRSRRDHRVHFISAPLGDPGINRAHRWGVSLQPRGSRNQTNRSSYLLTGSVARVAPRLRDWVTERAHAQSPRMGCLGPTAWGQRTPRRCRPPHPAWSADHAGLWDLWQYQARGPRSQSAHAW
jgi:hypothetical protein